MIKKLPNGNYELIRKIRRRGSLKNLRRLERRVEDALDTVTVSGEPRDISVGDGIDSYLASRHDEDLARDTVRQYRAVLIEIDRMLDHTTLGTLDMQAVEQLRHRLRKHNAASTTNRKIDLLKRYARWAARTGRWSVDPRLVDWIAIPALRTLRRAPKLLTVKQLVELVKVMPPHVAEILTLSMLTVARPRAILSATWRDVIWPDNDTPGVIRFPTLKRGVDGAVMFLESSEIHHSLMRARELYYACRCAAAGVAPRYPRAGHYHDTIFITRRSARPWTVSTLDHVVAGHLRRAGVDGVTPYTIRRSIITTAWHLGGSAGEVRALAKHRQFATTERYIIEDSSAIAMRERLELEVVAARG